MIDGRVISLFINNSPAIDFSTKHNEFRAPLQLKFAEIPVDQFGAGSRLIDVR